jgi:hypothetical protein
VPLDCRGSKLQRSRKPQAALNRSRLQPGGTRAELVMLVHSHQGKHRLFIVTPYLRTNGRYYRGESNPLYSEHQMVVVSMQAKCQSPYLSCGILSLVDKFNSLFRPMIQTPSQSETILKRMGCILYLLRSPETDKQHPRRLETYTHAPIPFKIFSRMGRQTFCTYFPT